MKASTFIFLFYLTFCPFMKVSAAVSDSTSFFRKFNFAFNVGEFGPNILLNEKRHSGLVPELDLYAQGIKGNGNFGVWGVALYFKEKFGVEFMYSAQNFTSKDNLTAYLALKHPNHYVETRNIYYTSYFNGLGVKLCYRQTFKHFFIEPRFQYKFNAPEKSEHSFRLKEVGTNQFIHYTLKDEIIGNNDSYHFQLNFARRFNPFKVGMKFELGLVGEYMFSPVKQVFIISEQPYGQAAVIQSETLNSVRKSASLLLSLKLFFGYKETLPRN